MRKLDLLKEITGVALGLTLFLALGLLATVNAQGGYRNQDPRWDGYPNWGGSFELRQTALNAGYNEGSKEGRNERTRARQTNYRNFTAFSAYQNATKGYSSRFGDRELYRRYFRLAFETGYNTELGIQVRRDGDYRDNRGDRVNNPVRRGRNWDRYGAYGGSFELRQTALNAGYNEGIKEGRKDRQRGRYRDLHSFSAYQNATTDYSSKLGDRELYRRYYREGFENGYSDGLNGA